MVALTAGVVAGAMATFGTDRVVQCITETIPGMVRRPLGRVMNAAYAVSSFVASFFRAPVRQTSRRPGGVAAMAASALSSVSRCFCATSNRQHRKKK